MATSRDEGNTGQRGAADGTHEVQRSITIGSTPDELRRRWLDPQTLTRIMAGFAAVRTDGDRRQHWEVEGPLGRTFEWDSETIDDLPGEGVAWRSLPGADIPNEGSIRFRTGPADVGSEAALRIRFDPPAGALGEVVAQLVGDKPLNLAADGVLRRFKSLVETGEIPTTERQPAARDNTR